MSRAGKLTQDQRARYLDLVAEYRESGDLESCELGHQNCATYDGGPCSVLVEAIEEAR